MSKCQHCGEKTFLTHFHACKKETDYLYVYLAKDNSVAFKPRASLEVMNEDYMGKVKYKDFMESLRGILLNE